MKLNRPPIQEELITRQSFKEKGLMSPGWYQWIAQLYDNLRGIKAGTVILYSGADVPFGFLKCDGSAISRTAYRDLFAVIGTTFGVGDGVTTFGLPTIAAVVANCTYWVKT